MSVDFIQEGLRSDALWIGLLLLLVSASLLIAIFAGFWIQKQKDSVSPYTGTPLRRAETLTFYSKEQILRYLYEHNSYDNKMFKLKNAAFCRDTGRIFSDAITWYDTIKVDWSFIQKRYKGNFVSWGSLTHHQQDEIKRLHGSLKGFQILFSSPNSSPRDIEASFAMAKPGPLYVDVDTKVVLGWKCVPGTDFEVLIIQKPIKLVLPNEVQKST